jgi:hypothetical protein
MAHNSAEVGIKGSANSRMAYNKHNPRPTVTFWVCVAVFVALGAVYLFWALVRALQA